MPDPDGFTGFDHARHALWCHEARARVAYALSHTMFLHNEAVAYVHIDSSRWLDRAALVAFDDAGRVIGADTVYTDAGSPLNSVPEFEATARDLPVAADSALAQSSEDGWLIDMNALREYSIDADRRSTQKIMFLALMQDMIADGDARCLIPQSNKTSNQRDAEVA